MKTILYPPTINFSFLTQLPQQIMMQFANNGWKVIFCNQTQIKGKKEEEVYPNLFVYHDVEQVCKEIKSGKLKLDIKLATWAKSVELFDNLPSKLTIYYSCDSFEDWKPYEQQMLDKSDIVLCTSQFIYDLRKKQHKDKNVHLVRNAATSSFINNKYTIPEDLKILKQNNKKIVGFVGAVGRWVSTYLIRKVAEKYTTVLIGAEFGKNCPSNVINLGVKSHDDLINYYNAIDIFLLPFNTKSEVTLAACPIKLYEYLSIGNPIISTSWDETELFNYNEQIVLTSKTDEEFMLNIDKAINMSSEELNILKIKSVNIATNNTWEVRYEQIENAIKSFMNERGI